MIYVIYILSPFAAIGAVTVARWLHELWRTRKDKGYPWMGINR